MAKIEIERTTTDDVADRADHYRIAVSLFQETYGQRPTPQEAIELARYLVGDYS